MTKIALVTGGNSGIGFEVVRGLARQGMTVWLAGRDAGKVADAVAALASEGDIRPLRIDMTDEASFAPALAEIEAAHGRLDILVNNAGAAFSGNALTVDPETIRLSFETNVHGPMRLTQLAVPLLRASAAGRIVNVSSGASQFSFMGHAGGQWDPALLPYSYCTAKTALNAATVLFAQALRAEGIKVNACNPGHVNTQVSRFQGTRTPAEGARIILELATLPDDGPTGGFFDEKGPLAW